MMIPENLKAWEREFLQLKNQVESLATAETYSLPPNLQQLYEQWTQTVGQFEQKIEYVIMAERNAPHLSPRESLFISWAKTLALKMNSLRKSIYKVLITDLWLRLLIVRLTERVPPENLTPRDLSTLLERGMTHLLQDERYLHVRLTDLEQKVLSFRRDFFVQETIKANRTAAISARERFYEGLPDPLTLFTSTPLMWVNKNAEAANPLRDFLFRHPTPSV